MVGARVALLCLTLVVGVGCKKKVESQGFDPTSYVRVQTGAATVPQIKHPVTDLAGVLGASETERIARELVEHQTATGVQLAVLVIHTTGDLGIHDYAQQVFDAWGGGTAGKDDGALFILAVTDRRNRLHLGYGLEPVIPDALAKRMLDELRPELRAGNYAAATSHLVSTFRARTAHLEPGGAREMPLATHSWMWLLISSLGLAAGFLWALVFRKARAARRRLPKRTKVDFFRDRPVLGMLAGFLAVQLAIVYLFPFHSGIYSMLFWMGIPIGWLIGLETKVVSITATLFALAFVIAGAAVTHTLVLLDGSAVWVAIAPLMGVFAVLVFIGAFVAAAIADARSGRSGGSSYSSSSSSRSSSSSYSSRSSSSSSSSYSSRSYSGGGGRSGGGGASSSW